ncbi:MAG: PP2C family serine/threonine-protein phosphatase [Longimicrobiales bacterium]|nr:PP2C family serine/threonine-protein phosphatase [Longimicrobiales bacterium]
MPDEPRLASESIAGQRPYQEDSVLVRTLDDGRVLVAVADGMGGHAAGEVASALALEVLEEALRDGIGIDKAFVMANRAVHDKAKDPGKHGMGTTLTAALVDDGEFMVANVGDSRGYLISDAGIRQITEDHSFVAEAMKRGQSEAQAMDTPYKDALTRSIGTGPDVEVDVFGPFPVKADTALLICSDGLYKTLDDEELRKIFVESGSARGAAQTLVSAALENGSDDNISVAIAEYGEVPRVQGQSTVTMEFDPSKAPDDPGPVTEEAGDLGSVAGAEEEATSASEAEEAMTGDLPAAAPPEPRLDTHAEARQTAASDDTVATPEPGAPSLPKAGIAALVAVVLAVLAWLVLGG